MPVILDSGAEFARWTCRRGPRGHRLRAPRLATPADWSSRIANHDRELWHRLGNDSTRADDGPPTHVLHDYGVDADPAIVADGDALLPASLQSQRDVRPVDVVLLGSAQQHRVLRDA